MEWAYVGKHKRRYSVSSRLEIDRGRAVSVCFTRTDTEQMLNLSAQNRRKSDFNTLLLGTNVLREFSVLNGQAATKPTSELFCHYASQNILQIKHNLFKFLRFYCR